MLDRKVEDLVTIGEFAAAVRLSQKALRLYGENGLLVPAWVDPETGYRYYGLEQLRTATLIALLRRAGMSLAEIRAFLRAPSVARVDEYEWALIDELAERRRVLRYLKRVLKEGSMYDVMTKQVDEQRYVSRNERVFVPQLTQVICEAFEELSEREATNGTPRFVLYHGPVNNDEDGPIEVCVPRRDGDKLLPAGEVAFTQISGDQCEFPEVLGAYEAVYRWIRENEREYAGPPREIYVEEAPDLRLEIAVPLR
jgi:DNA-binding transcriptional MerR regulator